jgi:hypothetical protein
VYAPEKMKTQGRVVFPDEDNQTPSELQVDRFF